MAGEVAVFVDTNLGTRIAFNAHPDITAEALKRDFERVHFRCLPDTGEIHVDGLMVKRKSCFYYLPDSLPIKHAFPEMRRTWFLHVKVSHSKCLCTPCAPYDAAIISKPQDIVTCNDKNKAICYAEEKRIGVFHENYMQSTDSRIPEEEKPTGMSPMTSKSKYLILENEVENPVKLPANSMQSSLSKMSTQAMSVTGIIDKYFSGSNGMKNFRSSSNSDVASRHVKNEIEVQSNTRPHSCSKRQIDLLSKSTAKKPRLLHAPLHVDLVSKNSGDKKRRSIIGKSLLVASRSLGASLIKRSPSLSLCKFKDRNQVEYKSKINGSIFSISDSDN